MSQTASQSIRDFDLFEMPTEGVAAYWLSLKKLVGNRRNFKGLDQEAEFTSEPFVRHLLDIVFTGDMSEDRVRRCAAARGDLLRGELDRRLDLMRVAIMDVAGGENPLRTMARIAARYPSPPITTEKALGYAQELLRQAGEKPPAERFFDVSHRLQDDRLVVALLFYVLLSRHHGRMACRPFLEHLGSRYFADGMALVADGFDAPFVRKWLKKHKQVLLADVRDKMTMSVELALGIKARLSYDDVFRIARSYMR